MWFAIGEEAAREKTSPALPTSARMSPHQAIPGRVASLQSPLLFHLVWLFRCWSGSFLHTAGEALQGQAVLAVVLEDEPLLGSLGDGQLGGALGALRAFHDDFPKLVVAQWFAGQSLADVGHFHLAPGRFGGRRTGGREPQGVGIEFEQYSDILQSSQSSP